jgi:hypothetical protein
MIPKMPLAGLEDPQRVTDLEPAMNGLMPMAA